MLYLNTQFSFATPALLAIFSLFLFSSKALGQDPNELIQQEATNTPIKNQTVKISGVSYATGVKLGLPAPVLIRAKALSENLNKQTTIADEK